MSGKFLPPVGGNPNLGEKKTGDPLGLGQLASARKNVQNRLCQREGDAKLASTSLRNDIVDGLSQTPSRSRASRRFTRETGLQRLFNRPG